MMKKGNGMLVEQEHFQKSMNLPNWRYHDLPKLSESDFDKFVKVAGEENLKWITMAEYKVSGLTLRRGQVMISPEGDQRLKDYVKSLDIESEAP